MSGIKRSREVFVFAPVKVVVNGDEEVIGLVEPVSLDDCERSLREVGSYSLKDNMLDDLKDLSEKADIEYHEQISNVKEQILSKPVKVPSTTKKKH
jgi:hypothetical protein